ncbi:MAG: hypothetical protein ABR529_02315 [Actinomycetota bacterium]
MTRRTYLLLPLLLLGLVASGAPSLARQLVAADKPRVSGPLTQGSKRCEARKERVNGRVIAVARSCLRFYSFDPAFENNGRRDYGAIWLQVNIDSRRRWCATTVKADIIVPNGTKLHAREPKSFNARRRHKVKTKLVVDARNNASREGVIQKRFLLLPRTLRGRTRDDGRVWRTVWHGSSKRLFASASGIETSWPSEQDLGDFTARAELRYRIKKKPSC